VIYEHISSTKDLTFNSMTNNDDAPMKHGHFSD